MYKRILHFSSIAFVSLLFANTYAQELKLSFITPNLIECKSYYNEEHRAYTVITDSGLVQIDTYYFNWLTKKAKEIITDTLNRKDFKTLLSTHAHSCHVRGNPCFKETQQIAHKNVLKNYNSIRNNAQQELKGYDTSIKTDSLLSSKITELELITQLPDPALTFEDSLVLNFGSSQIYLYYFGSSGHSDSEILIYIPKEQTLVIGQIFGRSRFLPVIKSNVTKEDLKHKISILKSVLSKDIKHILSNHQGRINKSDLIFAKKYYTNLLTDTEYVTQKKITFKSYKMVFSLERKYPELKKKHTITPSLKLQNQQNLESVFNLFINQ